MNVTTNDPRKFLSFSFRLGGLLDILLVLGLAGTWVGCFRDWHWFLALFDHFRLQGAIACLVALVVLAWRRRWWLVGFAALSLAVNVWPLWQTSFPLPGNTLADSHPGLRIVSFNVYTSNTRYPETLAYLQQADADVILLMEINDAWATALQPLRRTHPYGTAEAQDDNFGIALYSRLPLSHYQIKPLVEEGMPVITAIVHSGDRAVRLIGTHPLPPRSRDTHRVLLEEMARIATLVTTQPELPAVVLGDFNATPWSPALNLLRTQSPLDFRTPRPVWRPTWNLPTPLTLPLDQALCTPPLFFEQREIGPDLGSDHRAQVLLMKWAQSAGAILPVGPG